MNSGKLNPHSHDSNTDEHGFRRAFDLFHDAARRVPAYADFLKKQGVDPKKIRDRADFAHVPLTNKQYFSDYSLKELNWDGLLDNTLYISTSSGSTGVPFFWPRGVAQDVAAGSIFRHIYEDIFESKKGSTLIINSFALGTWIAGFEFFNAAKLTADHGNNIVISTPGIDKNEAINQFRKLAPLFDRIVLEGYPPFIKDIIDEGHSAGIVWSDHDVRIITGGEAVSPVWREKVLKMIGKEGSIDSFVNVYGMAETGIVGHDTPLSTRMRKNIAKIPEVKIPADSEIVGLYQYYPELRYFESLPDSSLVLTSNAGLPLVRYDTRDTGGLLEYCVATDHGIDDTHWQLPFVYLYGRKDLSISFYALLIYVENVKRALENSSFTDELSGLFRMGISHTEKLDQQFDITIELARAVESSKQMSQKLTDEIVATLRKVNSEYAKLLHSIGDRALPVVQLVPFGHIETIPGRKHKWVKRA